MSTNNQGNSLPLSFYETKEIDWLWKQRIPMGCVTLLEGDGGVGKSSVIASIGSALSSGSSLPDDIAKDPVGILLLAAEDDPSVVLRPRFEANGANLEFVRCYNQTLLLDENNLIVLRQEIQHHNIKLVVIDPIVSFLGRDLDTSKATDVRSFMAPLHTIARECACAIVVVRHWNKSSTASASQRGSGSVDFRNAARSVLQVIKGKETSFLTLEKSNYGATGKTLTFSLQDKILKWTGSSDLSADEILCENQNNFESKSDLQEACDYLLSELATGPVQSNTINKNANDLGIALRTLKRARSKLGIVAKKLPGENKFYSYLPDQIPPDEGQKIDVGQSIQSLNVGTHLQTAFGDSL